MTRSMHGSIYARNIIFLQTKNRDARAGLAKTKQAKDFHVLGLLRIPLWEGSSKKTQDEQ